jgi:hypothetical protein
MFTKHAEGGKYYQTRHSLKAGMLTCVSIYSNPKNTDRKLYRNERNLVAINGLAFSDSALNGLKPHHAYPDSLEIDLQHLCNAIIDMHGHVTQIDAYLDDIGGNHIDCEHLIHDLSRPRSYKLHIRSNLIKDVDGRPTPPRPVGTGCYYGRKGATQAVLYRKDLSPHQGICTDENPLKYVINRFELRFRKAQARSIGQEIVETIAYMDLNWDSRPASITAIIAEVISKHFAYILPTRTNKHRAALEPSWKSFINAGLTADR